MENSNHVQNLYPNCQIVDSPTLYSHVAEVEMNFYCNGIQQASPADGKLMAGEKVAIHSNDDPLRPWIITQLGVIAQVEGMLRSIPL